MSPIRKRGRVTQQRQASNDATLDEAILLV